MRTLHLLPEMLVKTNAMRFRAHGLVWADPEFLAARGAEDKSAEDGREPWETYALGIAATPSLRPLEFLPGTAVATFAERYGGYGLARNGGGVRCLNLGDVQIKGIGVNPLIGADVLEGYSSGTLNMVEGVTEIIFSRLLNRIFPLGAVKTRGLIATHPTIATYKNADVKKFAAGVPCWGALLLRDTCLRPAHLMRAMFYRVAPEYKNTVSEDVVRLRRVQRAFRSNCGGDQGFLALLSRFIQASASQFAFARIARFAHGAATASNLALDGRWLDLPIASFLPANKNYRLSVNQVPFFDEHKILDPTLVELVYTYGKYNGVQLDVNPLLQYYRDLYRAFLHRHSGWLLGIPTALWPKPGRSKTADELVRLLLEALAADDTLIWNSPYECEPRDPVIGLLHHLYGGAGELPSALAKTLRKSDLAGRFQRFLGEIQAHGGDPRGFAVACALRALRRAYMSAFFYSGRLRTRIESLLESPDIRVFGDLIDTCDRVASWVYEDDGTRVPLFDSAELALWWSAPEAVFLARCGNDNPRLVRDPLVFIDGCAAGAFGLDGLDTRPMVRAMAATADVMAGGFTHAGRVRAL